MSALPFLAVPLELTSYIPFYSPGSTALAVVGSSSLIGNTLNVMMVQRSSLAQLVSLINNIADPCLTLHSYEE